MWHLLFRVSKEDGNSVFFLAVLYHLSVWLGDSFLLHFLGSFTVEYVESKLLPSRFPFKENRRKSSEDPYCPQTPKKGKYFRHKHFASQLHKWWRTWKRHGTVGFSFVMKHTTAVSTRQGIEARVKTSL